MLEQFPIGPFTPVSQFTIVGMVIFLTKMGTEPISLPVAEKNLPGKQ